MSGKVIHLEMVTRHDLPPDKVLNAAIGQLASCVILGFDEAGEEYFASSYADGGDVLWLMERCKKILMETGD
jgi:hypothetical protein